jgi:hypothetical protein
MLPQASESIPAGIRLYTRTCTGNRVPRHQKTNTGQGLLFLGFTTHAQHQTILLASNSCPGHPTPILDNELKTQTSIPIPGQQTPSLNSSGGHADQMRTARSTPRPWDLPPPESAPAIAFPELSIIDEDSSGDGSGNPPITPRSQNPRPTPHHPPVVGNTTITLHRRDAHPTPTHKAQI